MNKIKKIVIIGLTMLFTLCACSEQKDDKEDAADRTDTVSPTVSMFDLREAMLAADDTFPKMLSVSDSDENPEKMFSYISESFDYGRIEHFFISYSSDTENPSGEVVVIALKDSADVDDALNALKEHVGHRVKMYEEYDPDSVSRVKKAVVFGQAQYAVLIIAEKADTVKEAFENFLSK